MTDKNADTLIAHKTELVPGILFAGRYQIIKELGQGGMGKVYLVLDNEIHERIALKVLNPDVASDEKTVERFRNELKFSRKISHKNVCRMFDLGEKEGLKYISMEYVSGESLLDLLTRLGNLTVQKTLSITIQVCEGLAEAHKLDVVHRDLKPQNIMIDADGIVHIMDFGIARSMKKKGLTEAGLLVGTPHFMSPEQLESEDVDKRSDIYCMGVILYKILTGYVPYEGETPVSMALKMKTEPPPDPRNINDQVPENLARVIFKCLENEREKRYQQVEDLLADLKKIEDEIIGAGGILPEEKIPDPQVDLPEKKERSPEPKSRPRILVVDDKEVNVELIEAHLSPQYDVVPAYGGKEALEKTEQESLDLILLDVMMPDPDGYKVCKQLKENPKTQMIPVVMVTALRDKEDRIKALELGADDFLTKPIDRAELLARVKSLLRIRSLYDELTNINKTLKQRVKDQVSHIQSLSRLKQYFSPQLAERLVSDKDIFKPRRKNLSIFFVDIRNFNTFIETLEPEELLSILDLYFTEMTRTIFEWGGTVGKFISDGIMGFFGDPEECPNHAELAIKMGLEMKYKISRLNEKTPILKNYPLSIGIGINTGYVTVGNIGPTNHKDYTVIGRAVNVAAHLETKAEPGQILIGPRTFNLVEDIVKARELDTVKVKGYEKPLKVFEVQGLL
ncbi:MAG: protein kinase [Candidatus Aminicenantes bacterium]|nr:MAG: protein kinase [Candidatus Aminicenantes bacterium]